MADFSHLSYAVFTRNGKSSNFSDQSFVNSSGTLTDSQADMLFELNVPVTGAGGSGTFLGTYTDAGLNVYLVVRADADTLHLYSPFDAATTDSNLPNNIHETNDIDQGSHVSCFAAGTLITTPDGTCPVEALAPGSLITAVDGRPLRVMWVGRKTLFTRFAPSDRLRPVRFAAGALGEGLPRYDLTVTADHAMLVDGVLCEASALVNGSTIARVALEELGNSYTVYHIETDAHEVILANGAPSETWAGHFPHHAFDNHRDRPMPCGPVNGTEELPLPRVAAARQLPPHIRRRLNLIKAA